MKEFNFYQDQKCTIWYRQNFTIKANSMDEAIEFLKKHRDETIDYIEGQIPESMDIVLTDGEFLGETAEEIMPYENDNQSTIEVYDMKRNLISDNVMDESELINYNL